MSLFRRTFTKRGAPPGEIQVEPGGIAPRASVMEFDLTDLREVSHADLAEVPIPTDASKITWVDIQGIGDGTAIRDLGLRFGIHPLAVSDMVHMGQRPKVDRYDSGILVVLRMVLVDERGVEGLVWEQVSVFLGPTWVLTVQETHEDVFDPLRQRIRGGRKQIRGSGSDYLAAMVIDAIVDGYFPVLEAYSDELEEFEDLILTDSEAEPLGDLYTTKRELAALRRAAWPLRDALQRLLRESSSPLSATSQLHLRDTLDHVMQVVDVTESFRELASSLVDVHLSMVGQRTNDVMRVLTVISAIFIPLTFLAGIYGMNFDTTKPGNLPELEWKYGYLFFWGVCLTVGIGLLVLFRRLGWLGGAPTMSAESNR
ncbi:Magnesium transport protein CorA [Planctomycetes bacterium Poly30]|uniref:Magnesium transport protein CorA n=1 Tax=Saltatorellus ferox TaxID=2528018 RepID=A0A518ESX8_9BACT|nr:Magnesium transport protein CorA [Planctomycetes bacterium Poly30]